MASPAGKWFSIPEYAKVSGLTEGAVKELLGEGRFTAKRSGGEDLLWVEDPGLISPARAQADAPDGPETSPPASPPAPSAAPGPEPALPRPDLVGPAPGATEAVEGEAIASRFSASQELALQAERAISLVERSMSAFMMMHQEVVSEKDRFQEQTRSGLAEKDRLIQEKEKELLELKRVIKEKDQEIADLKMLAEILEGRIERTRGPGPGPAVLEKASVGDLMEDQLRYIMEDQMVKELLKE